MLSPPKSGLSKSGIRRRARYQSLMSRGYTIVYTDTNTGAGARRRRRARAPRGARGGHARRRAWLRARSFCGVVFCLCVGESSWEFKPYTLLRGEPEPRLQNPHVNTDSL